MRKDQGYPTLSPQMNTGTLPPHHGAPWAEHSLVPCACGPRRGQASQRWDDHGVALPAHGLQAGPDQVPGLGLGHSLCGSSGLMDCSTDLGWEGGERLRLQPEPCPSSPCPSISRDAGLARAARRDTSCSRPPPPPTPMPVLPQGQGSWPRYRGLL